MRKLAKGDLHILLKDKSSTNSWYTVLTKVVLKWNKLWIRASNKFSESSDSNRMNNLSKTKYVKSSKRTWTLTCSLLTSKSYLNAISQHRQCLSKHRARICLEYRIKFKVSKDLALNQKNILVNQVCSAICPSKISLIRCHQRLTQVCHLFSLRPNLFWQARRQLHPNQLCNRLYKAKLFKSLPDLLMPPVMLMMTKMLL